MNYSNNKKKSLFFFFAHSNCIFVETSKTTKLFTIFEKKKKSKYREIHTNTLNQKTKRNVYNNYESIIVFNNKIEELVCVFIARQHFFFQAKKNIFVFHWWDDGDLKFEEK